MLWKDLQKQNPDMTSTIDMIITRQLSAIFFLLVFLGFFKNSLWPIYHCREKLKHEQMTKDLVATVQAKEHENKRLANVCGNIAF